MLGHWAPRPRSVPLGCAGVPGSVGASPGRRPPPAACFAALWARAPRPVSALSAARPRPSSGAPAPPVGAAAAPPRRSAAAWARRLACGPAGLVLAPGLALAALRAPCGRPGCAWACPCASHRPRVPLWRPAAWGRSRRLLAAWPQSWPPLRPLWGLALAPPARGLWRAGARLLRPRPRAFRGSLQEGG